MGSAGGDEERAENEEGTRRPPGTEGRVSVDRDFRGAGRLAAADDDGGGGVRDGERAGGLCAVLGRAYPEGGGSEEADGFADVTPLAS